MLSYIQNTRITARLQMLAPVSVIGFVRSYSQAQMGADSRKNTGCGCSIFRHDGILNRLRRPTCSEGDPVVAFLGKLYRGQRRLK
jgi:hypothetical protein